MKLKEIHRTSTFAWSTATGDPWLATGTVAGALDASFSNDSQLEIWSPDFADRNQFDLGGEKQASPIATILTSARFNRLAWGATDATRPKGIIAGGMETGQLTLWDPIKMIEKDNDVSVFSNNTHTGPIRGLDFNPVQTNLLSSGAINGEIYIWNLQEPSKPYSPGTRSSKLDDITSLAWNRQVAYVLATSSNTGYTVVWDLRGKREVVALAYTGTTGQVGGGLAMGGRKGMSDVCWHPDNATRLVTASEDDTSPVIMLWDLRNARAPEKILNGHEKGILSLSWCRQDADLLLSCGKDNRSICWNPQTSEIIGELPIANNWAYEVQWCPSQPSLVASAAFDGTIAIHSLQTTAATDEPAPQSAAPQLDGADIFDAPSIAFSQTTQPSISLAQTPKWLKVPAGASFGFGGKLVSISNLPGASGANQTSIVHIRTVVTEKNVVDQARKLTAAAGNDSLKAFVEEKCKDAADRPDIETWKALSSLFRADLREELVAVLGFSKEEIAKKVAEAVEMLKVKTKDEDTPSDSKPHEPVVSFAEPPQSPEDVETEVPEASAASLMTEGTPSEISGSATSDNTKTAASTLITEPETSLFGDDNPNVQVGTGTPHTETAADFFSSMGTSRGAVPPHVLVPHHNYGPDSSVAATVGSRPSSIASDAISLKNSTFKIYPKEESIIDKLVTKSLVVGDFESAVSLCLSAGRFADALLLAVRGGDDLFRRTQKTYFEQRTSQLPYLRVFQSIVANDLSDIVQNADLREWQEIFVVLCTFAKSDEFWNLAEQLGQRLEFQGNVVRGSDISEADKLQRSLEYRKDATLCYLASNKLDKVVNVWLDEMKEEEEALVASRNEGPSNGGSSYATHAQALQTFIEKVTVFRDATKYVDSDLKQTDTASADLQVQRAYKLGVLYDRYFEYADLLAAQGLLVQAVQYINLTPLNYTGLPGSNLEFQLARERLLAASGTTKISTTSLPVKAPTAPSSTVAGHSNHSYAFVQQISHPSAAQMGYDNPYPPAHSTAYAGTNSYGSSQVPSYAPSQHVAPHAPPNYATPNGSGQPANYGTSSYVSQSQNAMVPPPPPPISSTPPSQATQPPSALPRKVDKVGGWNDAPVISKSPGNAGPNAVVPKRAPITSPFPQSSSPAPAQGSFIHGQVAPSSMPPPPPRGGTPLSQLTGPPRPGSGQNQLPPPPPPGAGGPRGVYGRPQTQPGLNPPRGPPSQGPPGPYPAGRPMLPESTGPSHDSYPAPGRIVSSPPPSQSGSYPHPPPGRIISPPQGQPQVRGPPSQGPPPQPRDPRALNTFSRATPPPGSHVPPSAPSGPIGQLPRLPAMGGSAPQPGAYGPPSTAQATRAPSTQGAPQAQQPGPPSLNAPPPAPPKSAPPKSKYPPGDRSHIPNASKPIFDVLSAQLDQLRQTTPPQQKRVVDDTERRLNLLFDALNCEMLGTSVIEQLLSLVRAVHARNRDEALAIHMNLLTTGSRTDDIGTWMSGVKQLLMRM